MGQNIFPKKFDLFFQNSMLIASEWLQIDRFWRRLIQFTFKIPKQRFLIVEIVKNSNLIPTKTHVLLLFTSKFFGKL